jgi:hypothetical protein
MHAPFDQNRRTAKLSVLKWPLRLAEMLGFGEADVAFPEWAMLTWVLVDKTTVNAWKTTSLALQGCVYICLALWIYITSTVCSSPTAPDMADGHTIAYNCHGSIIFITRAQHMLLTWLSPAMVVVGAAGLAVRKRAKRRDTAAAQVKDAGAG